MNSAFQYDRYLLKRQVFALTGKLRFYTPQETLVLFCEQKMFRLREDIRVLLMSKRARKFWPSRRARSSIFPPLMMLSIAPTVRRWAP